MATPDRRPSLPIARYRFTAKMLRPLHLPDYAGSLLRGQFGAALRNVACMTRAPACAGCPLLKTCPYTRIFEAPPPPKGAHSLQDFSQIPNPYIIEPPARGARTLSAGEPLVFHLVLVGQALGHLALILFAIERMLARGLARERAPAELLAVECITAQGGVEPVWRVDSPTIAEHDAALDVPPLPVVNPAHHSNSSGRAGIKLVIHTPLRLQHQSRPLGVAELSPRTLIAAVARRTALLMEFHDGAPCGWPFAAPQGAEEPASWGEAARAITRLSAPLTDQRDLQWFDWTRFSSRQQQEMTPGGVLGEWTLHGDPATLAALWPWLWLGQWLHVGKLASMGMGGYVLTDAAP